MCVVCLIVMTLKSLPIFKRSDENQGFAFNELATSSQVKLKNAPKDQDHI